MKRIVLLLCINLFVVFTACAQQKKIISYTVKKGESVKEIAKDHGVKSKEIMKLNPGLKKKPAAKTVVLIPNIHYNEAIEKAREQSEIASSRHHIVQEKETLYGISKKYHVSLDSLKEKNKTLLIEGLKIGMVLSIPKEKMQTEEEVRQNELDYWSEIFVLHTVVKDDTLFSLTRKYNVSQEEVISLNPEVKDGLKLGMILKIKEKLDDKIKNDLIFRDSIVSNDVIELSLLLPFKFSKNDTLSREKLFTSRNNLISIITDFYLGADIAIDSLRKQGVSISVTTYDTENNRDTINSIIKSDKFKNTDVVFGPVFNKHVNHVASELDDIPVVFPFYSSNQKSFIKENIIKTVTDREVLRDTVLSYVTQIYDNENIIVVGDSKATSKNEFIEIEKYLLQGNDSIKEVKFLQPKNGYISQDRFAEKMDSIGVNYIILTSNNKVVTADVINNLKSIPNNAEVRLFAFEKAGNFDKVDNNMLADLNFVYASSGVMVDTLQSVSNFYAQYLRKNNSYPSKYATKGFDVTYDILLRMASNDSLSLIDSFDKGLSKRVKSTFKYSQKEYGGAVYNTAVYLRKYNGDLTIKTLGIKNNESKNIDDFENDLKEEFQDVNSDSLNLSILKELKSEKDNTVQE